MTRMARLYRLAFLCLAIMSLLYETSANKKGTSVKKPTKTQANYPRQPSPKPPVRAGSPNQQHPVRGGSNPYPPGGSYPSGGQQPGRGSSNPGGYPNQYPAGGSYPSGGQQPGIGGNNPYPPGGSYPSGGQQPGRGGNNPYPPGGSYPSGGQQPGRGGNNPYPPGGSYPSGGQQPGRGGSNPGGYPNQYPAGGSYPSGGQQPGIGGNNPYPPGGSYPSGGQQPGRGGSNPGGYPNQYPAGGKYPAGGQNPGIGGVKPNQGGYPNQYPARTNPGGSPFAGGYPVRTGGQPGGYPGGYPSAGGFNPNWNPNNKILSPRYGGQFGGGFGGPGYGIGGSPFSRSAQKMGYAPSMKSKGFAKKAMLAAGVGAMAGMAVGYGLGRFPRPHFNFNSPQEEYHYNHYMHHHYGIKSTDEKDYGRDYTFKPPPQAQSYEKYMDSCMNRTDLLPNRDLTGSSTQRNNSMSASLTHETSEKAGTEKVDTKPDPERIQEMAEDTVSIEEIGYPALIQQVKARKCVELYMVYSEGFLQKQTGEQQSSRSDPHGHSGMLVLLSIATLGLIGTLLPG